MYNHSDCILHEGLVGCLRHNIESEVIERRYIKGIKNLFDIYLPIVDGALIFDNSYGKHLLIAKKNIDRAIDIIDEAKFNLLKEYYDNN